MSLPNLRILLSLWISNRVVTRYSLRCPLDALDIYTNNLNHTKRVNRITGPEHKTLRLPETLLQLIGERGKDALRQRVSAKVEVANLHFLDARCSRQGKLSCQ